MMIDHVARSTYKLRFHPCSDQESALMYVERNVWRHLNFVLDMLVLPYLCLLQMDLRNVMRCTWLYVQKLTWVVISLCRAKSSSTSQTPRTSFKSMSRRCISVCGNNSLMQFYYASTTNLNTTNHQKPLVNESMMIQSMTTVFRNLRSLMLRKMSCRTVDIWCWGWFHVAWLAV